MSDKELVQSGDEADISFEEEVQQAAEQEVAVEEKEVAAEQPAKDDRPKTVPIHALHEARLENKRMRAEIEESRNRTTKMEERFNALMAQLNPEPSAENDPVGAIMQQFKPLSEQVQKISQRFDQQDMSREQESQQQAYFDHVQGLTSEFMKTNPDYKQAYDFIVKTRLADFEDLGYSPDEAQQALTAEEIGIANRAMAAGRNPAEVVYGIAKRYGYQASQSVPKAQDKVTTIKKGLEAAKTVNSGGGNSDVSLAALSQLSEEEFDDLIRDPKWWKKNITGGAAA